jgi:signal transduction histidine kinase
VHASGRILAHPAGAIRVIVRFRLRLLAAVAAAVAGLVGALMAADWLLAHGGLAWAERLPHLPDIGSGAGLLLAAVALACLMLDRPAWAGAASLLLMALGLAALATAGFSQPTVVDSPRAAAAAMAAPSYLAHAQAITPLLALALLTAAIGLLAAALPRRPRLRIVALSTLGGVVAAVAVISVIGIFAAWAAGGDAGRLRGMSTVAGLGLLAVGFAMVALAGQALVDYRASANGAGVHDAAPFAGLAFGALLTLTFLAFTWMVNDFQAQMRAKFKRTTVNAVDDIGDRMPAYALALRATAHYVREFGGVTRAGWIAHMTELQVTNSVPGMLSYGYLEAVPAAELPAHLRRMRKLWSEDYQVYPAAQRDEFYPVVLLEPLTEPRRKLIGFDLGSEAARAEGIAKARDGGEPALSRNIVLVVDRDKANEFSFQMYMPVYRKGLPLATVAQRRRALMGLVITPFRMNDFMRSILQERYEDIRVRVLDGDFASGAQLVYDSAGVPDGSVLRAEPPGSIALGAIVFGRRWTVVTSPLQEFFAGEPGGGPWIVLAGGIVISLLLAAAIWQVFAIQARVRSLAAAQALHAATESRLRAEQALRVEREGARLKVEALNRQLSQRAADLEIANRDLEAFSYSVSHDLQQPVTGIAGYASMALEDFTGEMSPEVKGFFERIQVAGFRMSQLISGLLALSSIARSELTRTPVDLTALAREAIAELEATHKLREIEIVIAEGLSATGDKRLLQILVTNLLGNAWKYTGKTAHPRIELGTTQAGQDPSYQGQTFFVRDNGAGFEMAKAAKLACTRKRTTPARASGWPRCIAS